MYASVMCKFPKTRYIRYSKNVSQKNLMGGWVWREDEVARSMLGLVYALPPYFSIDFHDNIDMRYLSFKTSLKFTDYTIVRFAFRIVINKDDI